MGADSNLGNASGGLTFNGGTLAINASGFGTSARAITVNGGGGTIDNGGNTITLSGVISGTGALTFAGAGTTTLSGTNTYSGGTTVNAGTLQGTTASLQGNIADNNLVIFNQAGSGTYAGVLSGTGNLLDPGRRHRHALREQHLQRRLRRGPGRHAEHLQRQQPRRPGERARVGPSWPRFN